MNKFLLGLVASIALVPLPVNASQPISESLVDCAALFTISNRAQPERKQTRKGQALDRAYEQLLSAARERARQEGRPSADEYVSALVLQKSRNWDEKGISFVFTQEFRDWAGYCHSLSEHLDIALLE